MAAESNADKIFVALPETYEDGLPVLSWVLSHFPQDKTTIILTHVITWPSHDDVHPNYLKAQESIGDMVLTKYLQHCASYKFQAEKLVLMADNIAEGIVQVIGQHETKNLVMRSAGDSDMTNLASETARQVMREANLSCKLWFVSHGNLMFTREVNSNNLTTAPTSEERNHQNGDSTKASSSRSAKSNSESTTEEGNFDVDASVIEMLHEASIAAENFEKIAEVTCGAHKKMGNLVINLAKKLEQKEQEMREHKENLQREKQEKDQLREEIEQNKHISSEEIKQLKMENDQLRRQRDEYFNQIQVSNERRRALETQVSYSDVMMEVIQASAVDRIDSLQAELCNLERERDDLMRTVEELCIQSEFSLQELEQATQNFSESLKIGQGGFGPVYKGSIRQTTVAIKLLHSESLQGISQFQQEITVLTKVRHPNLVTLIGACSEASALVYEYLSNGSLEDRLTRANNTPPLTWQARTRIISEICLALIFLHSNKPHLVVHGDLKPENILLDTNMVSKLSDFGISRLLKQPDTNITAFLQTSHPAGTLVYMDPEYLTTGTLTPKSDIYSFGIIILRLLTGKPPFNIARQVQDAMRDGILPSVIDQSAGTWPFEHAEQLAKIALRCAELSRSQRPDLVNEVWAAVEPLRKSASQSQGSELGEESIPAHFICPISQDIMQDPYIAADGFTYEAEAIRQWLRSHTTSPMTNLPLPNHNLIPNRVLRSAIQEWRQQHAQC